MNKLHRLHVKKCNYFTTHTHTRINAVHSANVKESTVKGLNAVQNEYSPHCAAVQASIAQ